MKISIGYPRPDEESYILTRYRLSNPIDDIKPVAAVSYILSLQEEIKTVHVDY